MKNLVALNEVIYPELEPGVISNEMIIESFRQGYKGEAARLKDLEEIDYNNITLMRLEFKNILRIEHLWILPNLTKLSLNFNKLEVIENIDMLSNLKELDLSFNYIEKIENLESLTKLETLSLFNNLITEIENLDKLENLIILSIGNNKITSLNGIERFRFFKNLKVLNLDGNPATDNNPNIRYYIAAVLPNLIYYKYIYINQEEREDGNNKFERELREISNNEEFEVNSRLKNEQYQLEVIRLENSFIEDFSEAIFYENNVEHFSSFLDNLALYVGSENDQFIYNYKKKFIQIGKDIYNNGYEKFQERKNEIKLFNECTKNDMKEFSNCGRMVIEDYIDLKLELLAALKKQCIKIEKFKIQGIDGSALELIGPNEEIERISEDFNNKTDEIWELTIKQEINIYESMEDAINILKSSLTEMINAFLSQFKEYISELQKLIFNFDKECTDNLKIVDKNKVPGNVILWFQSKANGDILRYISNYKHDQTEKLTMIEISVVKNATIWLEKIIQDKIIAEIHRNRNKLSEINHFLNKSREELLQISSEAQDESAQDETNEQ